MVFAYVGLILSCSSVRLFASKPHDVSLGLSYGVVDTCVDTLHVFQDCFYTFTFMFIYHM